MPTKRKITINRKKKEPVVEVEEKVVSLEEAMKEIAQETEENPVTTDEGITENEKPIEEGNVDQGEEKEDEETENSTEQTEAEEDSENTSESEVNGDEENSIETEVMDEVQVMFTRSQLKGEIVGNGTRTIVQQPRGRIKFEAQVAAVPLFKLPDDIRRYLVSNGLPTTVWQWDKEKLEKRNVDVKMVEKLKKFLSSLG